MRLIDADALLDEFLKQYTGRERDGNLVFAACEIKQDFADMISDAHTVDAMPVVCCKDCIHSYEEFGFIYCTCELSVDGIVPPDFYCAVGKKKEGSTWGGIKSSQPSTEKAH